MTSALRRLLAKETLEAAPGEGVALFFVDLAGKLTAANASGESILSRYPKEALREDSGLPSIAGLAARELRAPSGAPIPPTLFVDPYTRRRYRLVVERLLGDPASARALLIAEPVRALDSVELLRTTGLTDREADVALATLRGFRSAEGAEALDISEHTFLSHLKMVYKKLGVGSRGELAAVLLSGL